MERLMVVMLEAVGCAAEVLLNGMPVAALGAEGGRACMAVHEYTLAGRNRMVLAIHPAAAGEAVTPQPRIAIGATWARATLLLPRMGRVVNDPSTRVLGAVEWAVAEGTSFDVPAVHAREFDLPVNFPRWRWLDAPVIELTEPVRRQILGFVQKLAVEMALGNAEPLLQATRLRFDELALAYQTSAEAAIRRFRDDLQQRFAAGALKIVPPTAQDLVLRPLVDGRLVACLAAKGGPALHTQNGDPALGEQAWPLRLAMVEGNIYVLR